MTLSNDIVEVNHLLVSHLINMGCNPAMDIHAIRRKNLRNLIDRETRGVVAEFARRYDLNEVRLSQLLSTSYRDGRNFGEKMARKIESATGIETFVLDSPTDGAFGTPADPVLPKEFKRVVAHEPGDTDFVEIRKVSLKLSAGIKGFIAEDTVDDGKPITFRNDWLMKRGYSADKLIAIGVKGDSMEPTMSDGDTVVINTADIIPKEGEAFAINYDGEDVIKRLIKDYGQWFMASDNPDQRRYHRQVCTQDQTLIIGRIVLLQRERI